MNIELEEVVALDVSDDALERVAGSAMVGMTTWVVGACFSRGGDCI
jgi:hypothetical protein